MKSRVNRTELMWWNEGEPARIEETKAERRNEVRERKVNVKRTKNVIRRKRKAGRMDIRVYFPKDAL